MPTLGTFGMGTDPGWTIKNLLDRSQKKGKGQQDMLVGELMLRTVENLAKLK